MSKTLFSFLAVVALAAPCAADEAPATRIGQKPDTESASATDYVLEYKYGGTGWGCPPCRFKNTRLLTGSDRLGLGDAVEITLPSGETLRLD